MTKENKVTPEMKEFAKDLLIFIVNRINSKLPLPDAFTVLISTMINTYVIVHTNTPDTVKNDLENFIREQMQIANQVLHSKNPKTTMEVLAELHGIKFPLEK